MVRLVTPGTLTEERLLDAGANNYLMAVTRLKGGSLAGDAVYGLAWIDMSTGDFLTQPVTALQLVWSVAIGAIFFAEPVDPWVILGGALVVSAVVFIALREHRLKKEGRL